MSEPNHTPDAHATAVEKRKPGRPSKYTEEQRRRGLLTLAKHGGNSVQAEAELAEQDIHIPASTLRDWRYHIHPELYAELHVTYTQEIEARLIPEYRDTALIAAQVARNAVLKSQEQLDAGQVKDPGTLARNLMVTSGTSFDKLMLATERPTVRTDNTDIPSLIRAVEAVIPGLKPATDTTAEEIQDAQTIENPPQLKQAETAAPPRVSD